MGQRRPLIWKEPCLFDGSANLELSPYSRKVRNSREMLTDGEIRRKLHFRLGFGPIFTVRFAELHAEVVVKK